jgi:hypothetical protein
MKSEAIDQMNVIELYENYSRNKSDYFSEVIKQQFFSIIEELIVADEFSKPFCSFSELNELKSKDENSNAYKSYNAYYDRHSDELKSFWLQADFFEYRKDYYSYLQDIHIKYEDISKDGYLLLVNVSLCLFYKSITNMQEWLEYHVDEVAKYCKNDLFEAKRLIHASVLCIEKLLPSTTYMSIEQHLNFEFNPKTINDFVKAEFMAKFNHLQKRLEKHHFIDSSRRWKRKKKELVCLLSILIKLEWWYPIGGAVNLKESGAYLSKHFSVSQHSMKDYYVKRHLDECLSRFRDHFKSVFSDHDWRLINKM